jgi:hypothetical protein
LRSSKAEVVAFVVGTFHVGLSFGLATGFFDLSPLNPIGHALSVLVLGFVTATLAFIRALVRIKALPFGAMVRLETPVIFFELVFTVVYVASAVGEVMGVFVWPPGYAANLFFAALDLLAAGALLE